MATVQKSKLMQKIGNVSKVVKERVEKGSEFGPPRVPPGITNGVAKLTSVGFSQIPEGKNYAGEYQFNATGVLVTPDYIQDNGSKVKVRGCQTAQYIKCCTTGQISKEQNIDRIVNLLIDFGCEELLTPDCDLEQVANQLKARIGDSSAPPIYFRVSTKKGKATEQYPEPLTNEYWNGTQGLEDFEPPTPSNADGSPAQQDNSPTLDETQDSLDDLVAKADDNDGDAQAALQARARELGLTQKEVEDEETFPSWESLANYIRAGGAGLTETVSKEWEPTVGEKAVYKGKKHKILTIQGRSKTAHLEGVKDRAGKPLAVKLSELTEA